MSIEAAAPALIRYRVRCQRELFDVMHWRALPTGKKLHYTGRLVQTRFAERYDAVEPSKVSACGRYFRTTVPTYQEKRQDLAALPLCNRCLPTFESHRRILDSVDDIDRHVDAIMSVLWRGRNP